MTADLQPPKLPIENETAAEFYNWVFAPWVKELGLKDFEVSRGRVRATLPLHPRLQFVGGAISGQAVMAAVDTIAAMAMSTSDRPPKGTVYQHTHFLRPAKAEDLHIEVNVLRFGNASAFCEARVQLAATGDLVAHATLEFAF